MTGDIIKRCIDGIDISISIVISYFYDKPTNYSVKLISDILYKISYMVYKVF